MRSIGSLIGIHLVALAAAVLPLSAQETKQTVVLRPIEGFGPFRSVVHVSVPGENGGVWQRAQAEVRGIPVDLHGFSLRYLNMQMDQYIYQSYREDLIDPALALSLIRDRSIDTTKLSRKHVDQDIPIVAGFDGEGNTVFVVDTKDDHSFWGKDRIEIPPYNADELTDAQMDSLNALVERPVALFEYYDGSKIREGGATLRLSPYVRIPPADRDALRGKIVFGICVYEHRRGLLTAGGQTWAVAVSNGFLTGVYSGDHDSVAVFPASDTSAPGPLPVPHYGFGDRVALGDSLFRIERISPDGMSLTLGVSKARAEGAK